MTRFVLFAAGVFIALSTWSIAAHKPVKVTINFIDAQGVGKEVGTIVLKETADGVAAETRLKGLPRAYHGLLPLENLSSAHGADKDNGKPGAGMAAAGHHAPQTTKALKGSDGARHVHVLQKLTVDSTGTA